MQLHASCVARDKAGVLLVGPSGCGKSDLVLRLLDRGFCLVADDRVDIVDGLAKAPDALAGLLEVRGMGIVRLPHVRTVELRLVVDLAGAADRLPVPLRHPELDLPLIALDAGTPSAPARIALALDCALGRVVQVAGVFAA